MSKKKAPYAMIAPYFILYLAFGLFPILFSLGVSFTSWDGIGEAAFVGLKNYKRVFTQDKFFYKSMLNTLILLAISTPIQIALGLFMATFLKDFFKKTRNGLQLINFLPYITTPVAVGIIFQLMFDWKSGVINAFLNLLGIESVYWLGNAWASRAVVIFMIVWKNYGYKMIMFLSGLAAISDELYEAATIDGATALQRVRYISVPMLHNVICTCSVLAVTGALKVFDLPWVMFPKGMPLKTTFLTGTYMYYQTMETKNVDYGAALAVLIVVLGVVLAKVVNAVFREKDY